MISEERKRKVSNASKDENGSIDSGLPPKRRRKSEEDNDEEDSPSLGKSILLGVTWLIDITTRNYFVESAMSALKLNSRQNGGPKPRLFSKCEVQMKQEETRQQSIRNARPDVKLKRKPLHESGCKKSSNYFSVTSPLLNEMKSSSSCFGIRNIGGSEGPKDNSNVFLEKRKVIEHPFRGIHKFPKADFQQINNLSTGRKMEHKNGQCDPPSVTNSIRGVSKHKLNGSRSGANVQSAMSKPQVVGKMLYKNKGRTNEEALALQERDQYKLLLDQFTKFSGRQNRDVRSSVQDKEVQTNLCGQPPSCESSLQQHFSKKTLSSGASTFLAKYFKGSTCGISPNFIPPSKPSDVKRMVSVPKKTENEDNIIIAEVKMPQPRTHPLTFPSSPIFSQEWLIELKKTLDEDTEKNVELIRSQEESIKQYRELRAARLAAEDKAALEQLRISGSALEAEVDTSIEFPELTPKMEEIIDDALNPVPPEEVLSSGYNISISRKDIETLAGLNWLNDEIINFYMNLLIERSQKENFPSVYVFNTFFYPKLISGGHSVLKRWTRKVDIFAHDLILVPVHMGMHWCLAVIDFRHKKIRYYDSMGGKNTECLNALRDYLKEERMDKKKENYDMSGWVLENVKNIPHQMNGSDCGMFTLKYAEYITRDAKITFTQDHMQYFRKRMVYEILTRQLL